MSLEEHPTEEFSLERALEQAKAALESGVAGKSKRDLKTCLTALSTSLESLGTCNHAARQHLIKAIRVQARGALATSHPEQYEQTKEILRVFSEQTGPRLPVEYLSLISKVRSHIRKVQKGGRVVKKEKGSRRVRNNKRSQDLQRKRETNHSGRRRMSSGRISSVSGRNPAVSFDREEDHRVARIVMAISSLQQKEDLTSFARLGELVDKAEREGLLRDAKLVTFFIFALGKIVNNNRDLRSGLREIAEEHEQEFNRILGRLQQAIKAVADKLELDHIRQLSQSYEVLGLQDEDWMFQLMTKALEEGKIPTKRAVFFLLDLARLDLKGARWEPLIDEFLGHIDDNIRRDRTQLDVKTSSQLAHALMFLEHPRAQVALDDYFALGGQPMIKQEDREYGQQTRLEREVLGEVKEMLGQQYAVRESVHEMMFEVDLEIIDKDKGQVILLEVDGKSFHSPDVDERRDRAIMKYSPRKDQIRAIARLQERDMNEQGIDALQPSAARTEYLREQLQLYGLLLRAPERKRKRRRRRRRRRRS